MARLSPGVALLFWVSMAFSGSSWAYLSCEEVLALFESAGGFTLGCSFERE